MIGQVEFTPEYGPVVLWCPHLLKQRIWAHHFVAQESVTIACKSATVWKASALRRTLWSEISPRTARNELVRTGYRGHRY